MLSLLTVFLLGSHGALMAPTSDGGLWLVDRQNDVLWLDAAGTSSSRPVDGWPQAVALDETGNPVVTCREAKTLVRLNPDGGLDRLSLPGSPGPLATNGSLAIVGLRDTPKLVLVDLGAWSIEREISLPGAAADVILDTGGGHALLGEGGALLRFELGDGGVTQLVAATPRGRGVQLAQRADEIIGIVRVTTDDVVMHAGGSVKDQGFVVRGTRVSNRWTYHHRVVPGALTLGRTSLVAFEDGTVAELGATLENTARDLRDQWRLESVVAQGQRWVAFSATQRALITLASADVDYLSTNPGWVEVRKVRKLPPGAASQEFLRGERLFSIESPATSLYGFSCETCHPDGGSDGLRWRLKGRKSAIPTLPVHKTTRDSAWLQRHAVQLGGEGFTTSDVDALLGFVRAGFRQR